MDMESYLRFLAALVLVIALIAGIAWVVRRFGLAGRFSHISTGGGATLRMLEGRPFESVDLLDGVRGPPGA